MNQLGNEKKPFLFIINFNGDEAIIRPLPDINNSDKVRIRFESIHGSEAAQTGISPRIFEKNVIQYDDYLRSFSLAMDNLRYGNSYLLNLTFATKIRLDTTLRELYENSRAKYKIYVLDKFVCYSPETFIKIGDGEIKTYPMKGTIDASIPEAESVLINDKKEHAEHVTIVDLMRNDLSMVAENVHVRRFRYIDKIATSEKTLLQVSSEIVGNIGEGWNSQIGSIFDKLLPAGSITGAPKEKTVAIIKEAEIAERGFYTGIAGIYDGESLDSCVMIRFVRQRGDEYFYHSGGGITALSDSLSEYNEMIDKIYLPT